MACAKVSGEGTVTFVADDVSLNTLSPVLNCGLPATFGSGITKTPLISPLPSVTKFAPSEPPVGVQKG